MNIKGIDVSVWQGKIDWKKVKADGIVSGGMLPKIENSLMAVKAGVKRVVITRADSIGMNEGTSIEL